MHSDAETVHAYLDELPEERKEAMKKLRDVILKNLPEGFEEEMSSGMIGYVVPLRIFPSGYHASKGEPLPFMSLASQKNYIALYHMGLYAKPELEKWFRDEYKKRVSAKPDMGKSCIRLKKMEDIPYDLISELCKKITPYEYVEAYKEALESRGK